MFTLNDRVVPGTGCTENPGNGVERNSCTLTRVTAVGRLELPLSVIVKVAISCRDVRSLSNRSTSNRIRSISHGAFLINQEAIENETIVTHRRCRKQNDNTPNYVAPKTRTRRVFRPSLGEIIQMPGEIVINAS
jgi:hypothetical protein